MRKAAEFTVYGRNGIWHVQWLSNDGIRRWISTGERVRPELKTRGRDAALISAAKIVGRGPRRSPPSLGQYAKDSIAGTRRLGSLARCARG